MGYLSCRTEAALGTCENAHLKQKRQRHRPGTPHVFSFSQLQLATHNFAEECLLGKGSHGLVYKGVLEDGREVAIKRATFARQLLQDESSFDNELEILSKIWHERLVNLLGYTREQDEKLLVVEFMSNGTLHDNLHDSFAPLGWTMRIHLALQIAKGVSALHSASPPIIHRDIKSSNVLIDAKWNAKLGDFGLALRGHIEDMLKTSTPPAGTMGYLDPEYETPSDLSTKTDVFSFGILLLEIISGRNAIDLAYEPPSILDWALPLIKQGRITEVLDKKIPVPGNPKPLKLMINLAIKCVRTSRYRRPSMLEVVEELKDIYRKVSISSLDSLTRVVRKQRPWPSTTSVVRRTKVSSYPHHKRLLSQVSRLREETEEAMAQEEPRVSTPFATDCSEVESEPDSFMSANVSFRSSSASVPADLDEEMSSEDVKPRRVRKASTVPLSPCISPPGASEPEQPVQDPLCEIPQVQDLIISQYDLVEHPVSRCSSRGGGGSGSVRASQALRELQEAQLKAMNAVFSVRRGEPHFPSSEIAVVDAAGLSSSSERVGHRIRTLATTCLGAALRPCVCLKEEDEPLATL